MQDAEALSHLRDTIEIYSNSWGPSDAGIVVSGPGSLVQMAFEQGVAQVSTTCKRTGHDFKPCHCLKTVLQVAVVSTGISTFPLYRYFY